MITAAFGLAVGLRAWRVFPFDFGVPDFSWLARTIIVLVIVGSALGAVSEFVKLMRGPRPTPDEDTPS